MNDYAFGNYICDMRRRMGLSQAELAKALNVTNKAVSKWENGRAKPTTNKLRALSKLFSVPLETLLQMKKDGHTMDITKIVITGGPCAGKTTALSWIQNAFTEQGFRVLFVPETATELIGGGVAPWTCESNAAYQACQMALQLEKERIFGQAARSMKADRILIVCDRGALDNRAYMTQAEFQGILNGMNLNEVELRDSYDGVFHLVTAAKGAREFYTSANNSARTETPEEAARLDDRLIAAWTGHPHLRVIDNSTPFREKMTRLITEISSLLGVPQPFEIERKYLIGYPDTAWLESLPNCRKVEIIQTYLKCGPGAEKRIRQRGADGHYIYCLTEKRPVSDIRRVEIERRLTRDEYLRLLMDADTACRQIRKTRYCLTWEGLYFEIDVYPFWTDRAIVEIELSREDTPIRFPDRISVIREVTDDERYRNHSLARNPGPERTDGGV